MAYWGYFPLMKEILSSHKYPKVIEVGVDKGQTLIPLLHYMSLEFENFHLVGVDIHVRDELNAKLGNMFTNLKPQQTFDMAVASSLDYLPACLENLKDTPYENEGYFNLMLIDGDHNYHTVKREFDFIPHLLAPGGIVIFDDYDGRWSHQDEFFIEREGYADNKMALSREDGEEETKGVKPAVDEFLEANPDWVLTKHPSFQDDEPVILYRRNEIKWNHIDEDTDQ